MLIRYARVGRSKGWFPYLRNHFFSYFRKSRIVRLKITSHILDTFTCLFMLLKVYKLFRLGLVWDPFPSIWWFLALFRVFWWLCVAQRGSARDSGSVPDPSSQKSSIIADKSQFFAHRTLVATGSNIFLQSASNNDFHVVNFGCTPKIQIVLEHYFCNWTSTPQVDQPGPEPK